MSIYDRDGQEWIPTVKAVASWTPDGLQKSFEEYSWNGAAWEANQDKQELEYDADGRITLYAFSFLKDSEWVYYYRIRQNFDEKGQIVLQTDEYYNPEVDDWVGCYDWKGWMPYSTRSEFTYDDRGRRTLDMVYTCKDLSQGWQLSCRSDFEYTDIEDGGYRQERTMYLYEVSDKVYDILVNEYNAAGLCTFTSEYQDVMRNGDLLQIFEETYEYKDDKYLTFGETYVFSQDEANVRTAENREYYDYDADNNVIESRHEGGRLLNMGEGDPAEFMKLTKFTYGYTNGERIEKLAYMWNHDSETYDNNWGEGVEYDFNLPAENCIVWQDLKMDLTILKTIQYYGNAGAWDDMTGTYNYTKLNSGAGVDKVDGKLTFGPNPVDNVLYVNTADAAHTEIYGLNGVRYVDTDSKEIDVTGLAAGFYIVKINGKNHRMIKR